MSSEKPKPLPQGPLQVGQIFIWQYEILQLIGSGGHAFVYRARHRFLGHMVAIKVLHRAAGVSLEMLRRGQAEAQIEFQLKHPGIVSVLDAGIDNDGLLYIVMELLQGRSMRDALIELGKLEVAEVLNLGLKVALAMDVAHRAGVVHRDLKPENLFFTRNNNEPKVVDFGIAKIDDAAGWQTHKDMVMGTVYYMSPEQVMAQPVTPRSDIYSLGTILCEALLGQPPVLRQVEGRPLTFKLLTRIIGMEQLPPLNQLDPRIPPYVDKLITKATAKRPDERFASMQQVADACTACLRAYEAELLQRGASLNARDLSRKTPSASGVEAIGTPPEHDTAPASRPPFFGGLSSSTVTVAPTQAASVPSDRNANVASQKPTVFRGAHADLTAPSASPKAQHKHSGAASPSVAPSTATVAAPTQRPPTNGIPNEPAAQQRGDADDSPASFGLAPLVWGVAVGAIAFGAGAFLFLRPTAEATHEPPPRTQAASAPLLRPPAQAPATSLVGQPAPAAPPSGVASVAPSTAAALPAKPTQQAAPPAPSPKRAVAAPQRDSRSTIF